MDKANIIISIIIVLCIAAAVAAYGITNTDNPIFSDLSSIGANDNNNNGNGIGNTTVGNQPNSVATTGGSSGTGSGSGSGSSSGGSSSSSSGSSSNGGSNSNGGGSSSTQLTYSQAQAIAANSVLEEGCKIGSGYYSNGYWIFNVYDADGNVVDSIGVNDATGMTERV